MTTRLPVQHPKHPHCPACKADLPAFTDAIVMLPPTSPVKLEAVTFHIVCGCGRKWSLTRGAKEPVDAPKEFESE